MTVRQWQPNGTIKPFGTKDEMHFGSSVALQSDALGQCADCHWCTNSN